MAKVDTQIRKELRKKLGGISKQALSNRVRVIKDTIPAPPHQALYVLAFLHGLRLDRYLDDEALAEAADWLERYRTAKAAAQDPGRTVTGGSRRKSRKPSDRTVAVKVTGAEYKDIPKFMVGLVGPARRSAEGAYPLLFLFENSLRELITRVLHNQYGADWWKQVPQAVQKKASNYKANEAKDKWHTPRGSEPIQYVDLMDLSTIIVSKKLWPHFEPLFPRKDWVSNLVHSVNVSRRIVAHMNVLPKGDLKSLQTEFRKWAKQLKAHEHLIP